MGFPEPAAKKVEIRVVNGEGRRRGRIW